MFGLSQSSGYAIQALSCLGSDRCTHESVAGISACTGIPKPYLAKIIGRLVTGGLIISRRGNGGGIWLAKPAEKITLLEIAEKMEGEDFLGRCLLGEEFCSDERACPTHAFWKKERACIRKQLAATRLSDVVDFDDIRLASGISTQETLP